MTPKLEASLRMLRESQETRAQAIAELRDLIQRLEVVVNERSHSRRA